MGSMISVQLKRLYVYEAGQGKMNGCRKRKKEVKRENLLQPNHGYYLYHQHGKIDRKQMQKEGALHGFH